MPRRVDFSVRSEARESRVACTLTVDAIAVVCRTYALDHAILATTFLAHSFSRPLVSGSRYATCHICYLCFIISFYALRASPHLYGRGQRQSLESSRIMLSSRVRAVRSASARDMFAHRRSWMSRLVYTRFARL